MNVHKHIFNKTKNLFDAIFLDEVELFLKVLKKGVQS